MTENHKRNIKYSSDDGHPWEEQEQEEIVKTYESTAKVLEKRQEQQVESIGQLIYGKSLKWYKEVVIWPMFILVVIELGTRVIQTNYLFLWPTQIFTWIITGARIVLFIYLAITAVKQFKANKMQTITASIIGGVAVGLLLAIFQLFWYFELWTFFNLIGQPLLFAAEGTIISWIIYTIFFEKIK